MGGGFKHSIKGKRNDNDFYPTHHSMVWQLMEKIIIPENFIINDPACGENDILKALQEINIKNKLSSSDLTTGNDFLISEEKQDVVFTNPPFSFANMFLEKAMQISQEMIIFLLPLDYLHGKDRYDSFYAKQEKFYLSNVYIFVRRPMFKDHVREDGKYETGSVTFAWFIWKPIKNNNIPLPVFDWIDNNEYVIGSRKKVKNKDQGELF